MPDRHALLGPSSAAMWLSCPPSARLGESMEDKDSPYAREGTLAHRIGELLLRQRWEGADVTDALAQARADPLWSPSMEEHLEMYTTLVEERMAEASTRCRDPRIYIEQEVRFTEFVPEGFGTSDAILVSEGLLDVIDLKYGAGVPVSALDNPQMQIYALGAYLAINWAYDIRTVRMTIVQPRQDRISEATMVVDELLAWAEGQLRPKAAQAWAGVGEFHPSPRACRWCRAAPICRAHRDWQLSLASLDFAEPPLLSPEEVAQVLDRLPGLISWGESVKAWALDAARNGTQIPGYKLVEGRSVSRYGDEAAIAATLLEAGYQEGDIYKPRELLGVTAMRKLVGARMFNSLLSAHIIKPEGAPTLVPEKDPRPQREARSRREQPGWTGAEQGNQRGRPFPRREPLGAPAKAPFSFRGERKHNGTVELCRALQRRSEKSEVCADDGGKPGVANRRSVITSAEQAADDFKEES